MNLNNLHRNNSTTAVKAVCAIVFCLFSFVYLYFYQSDTLAVAQHVLSNGTTHYNRLIGALLITFVLQLLQITVYYLTNLSKRTHGFTYLPSFLLLAFVSDVNLDIEEHFSWGLWGWLSPVIFAVWGGLVYLFRSFQPYEPNAGSNGLFTKRMWMNMLTMALMMLMVGLVGTSNAVFHYRTHAECSLLRGDVDEAIRVGSKSLETDEQLTMLRVFALSKEGLLGEKLFSYPIVGGSKAMIPFDGRTVHCMILPHDSIYRHLGAIPRADKDVFVNLKAMLASGQAKECVKDYLLCAYLMDRNLDAFAKAIPQYYDLQKPIPRHYREALTLYRHLRSNPVTIFRDNVTETDYQDFLSLEKGYQKASERKLMVYDLYGNTYWYYYFYTR